MLITEPLLEEMRRLLRTSLVNVTQPTESIRITNEERVPPYSGEEFINIYGAATSNLYESSFNVRKEQHQVNVGITRRLIGIPIDSTAEAIYTYDENLISRAKSSIAKRAFEIISILDGNWDLVANIRDLDSLAVHDFCILTTLGYAAAGPLQEVTADHFYTDSETDDTVGLFFPITFTGLETYFNK